MPSFLQYAGAGLLGGASQVATDIGEAGLKAKEEEKKRKAAAEGQRLKHMYELQKLGVQHGLARKNIAYEQGLKNQRFAAEQQVKGLDTAVAAERGERTAVAGRRFKAEEAQKQRVFDASESAKKLASGERNVRVSAGTRLEIATKNIKSNEIINRIREDGRWKRLNVSNAHAKELQDIDNKYRNARMGKGFDQEKSLVELRAKLDRLRDKIADENNMKKMKFEWGKKFAIKRIDWKKMDAAEKNKINIAMKKLNVDIGKGRFNAFKTWALSLSAQESDEKYVTGSGVIINLGGGKKARLDDNMMAALLSHGSKNGYIIPTAAKSSLKDVWKGMVRHGYVNSVADFSKEQYNIFFKNWLDYKNEWIPVKFKAPTEEQYNDLLKEMSFGKQ